MKKLFILLLAGFSMWAFHVPAQKWVSTTPKNKNVVLEEFTGLHCGYCPDGHRIAGDLYTNNPGRVVLVNIHAGSFANPGSGEPDFRTSEGDALNSFAGVSGYPSGSVNRANSPWGQSRDKWTNLAQSIMGQASPVNVAIKASVDPATRKLTAEVEIYYTGNSAQSSNYLTVELLQDNYLAYQSDYGNYNPTKWMGSKYRHMHILRQVLSNGGANGEKLDTTTSGKYYYKKYEITLPASIKNVELVLHQLKVVAFVSETTANIYTGEEADVEFDPLKLTDLSIKDTTGVTSNLCLTSINPKIYVTNLMDQAVTSFTATLYLSGSSYTKNFSGELSKGNGTIVDFGTINLPKTGNYTFNAYGFDNINGGSLLERNLDNNVSAGSGIGLKNDAFSTVKAGFDVTSIPANFGFNQKLNRAFSIVVGTTTPCGAKGTSGAVRFPLHSSWGVSGLAGDIICGQADFTNLTDPYLSFYYAYSDDNYGGTAPVIKIFVSTDCGINWTELRSITCKQTGAPATHGYYYVPASSEYIWVGQSLAAYAGQKVLVKISGIPGTGGNAMYIDEISIDHASGISDPLSSLQVSVFPNPVLNTGNISFNLLKNTSVAYSIYNNLGQMVYNFENKEFNPGEYTLNFDASTFAPGTYVIKMSMGTESVTRIFVK